MENTLIDRAERGDIEAQYQINELDELSGCDPSYPELVHAHVYDDNDYCTICGADGRA